MSEKRDIVAIVGATLAASLCCVVPVIALFVGLGAFASMFSWLEPLHPYLVVITLLLLLFVWVKKVRKSKTVDCACSTGFFSGYTFLSIVTLFSLIMLSFPFYSSYFIANAPDASSCATGHCSSQLSEQTKKSVQPAVAKKSISAKTQPKALTVVDQFMKEEREHPKPNHQVACSGTGFYELDTLMFTLRKKVKEISPMVLKRMMDEEVDFVLLDVREFIQTAEGEIYTEESYAIPRTNLEFEIHNKIKDVNTIIVLYSRQGARSLFAAESLMRLGYLHVYNLSGGLKGWVREGYPFDNGLGVVTKVEDE